MSAYGSYNVSMGDKFQDYILIQYFEADFI